MGGVPMTVTESFAVVPARLVTLCGWLVMAGWPKQSAIVATKSPTARKLAFGFMFNSLSIFCDTGFRQEACLRTVRTAAQRAAALVPIRSRSHDPHVRRGDDASRAA